MNESLKVGGFLILLLVWLASLISGENAVFRTSTKLTPCVGAELSNFVHRTDTTTPIIISLSYKIDVEFLYKKWYGDNATTHPNHEDNFRCVEFVGTRVDNLIRDFVERLEKILTMRVDSYLNQKFVQKRDRRSVILNKVFKEIVNSTTTERNHTGSDHAIGKRSATAIWGIVLGLASLASTVTQAVYFGHRMNKLYNFISDVDSQLSLDAKYSATIAQNVRILKAESGAIAARTSAVYSVLDKLREASACFVVRSSLVQELAYTASFFNLLYDDLIREKLTSRVLDYDLVTQLAEKTDFFSGSLIERELLTVYREARISLLSVDVESRTVKILLASPRVQMHPSFVRFDLLSPKSGIKIENEFFSRQMVFNERNLALPIKLTRKPGFSVTNMTRSTIKKMRVLSECNIEQNFQFCRNFLPIHQDTVTCIEGLTQAEPSLLKSCEEQLDKESVEISVDVARGRAGLLLSASGAFSVTGIEGGRQHLLSHDKGLKDRGICMIIAHKYTQLLIKSPSRTFRVTQNNDVALFPGSIDRTHDFSTKHFAWFTSSFDSWFDDSLKNLSSLDDDFRLKKMERQIVHIRREGGSDWSLWDVVVVVAVAEVNLLVLCIVYRRYKQCKRDRRNDDDDAEAAQRDTVHKRFSLRKKGRKVQHQSTSMKDLVKGQDEVKDDDAEGTAVGTEVEL